MRPPMAPHRSRRSGTRVIVVAAVTMAWSAVARSSPLPRSAIDRALTLDERVEAQRAIEQVYWNHRVWPEQNPSPKPSLQTMMPDGVLRAKVEDDLKKSNALASIWNRPITAGQLQAEIDRMTKHTRDGRLLRELFAALGNDPTLIAETLARPALSDRLIRTSYAGDRRLHGDLIRKAEAAISACGNPSCMKALGGGYRETVWRAPGDPADRSEKRTGDRAVSLSSEEWKDHLQRLAQRLGGAAGSLPLGKLSALEETPAAFVVTAVIAEGDREITTATVEWKKRTFESWWAARSETPQARVAPLSAPLSLAAIDATGCEADTWAQTSTGTDTPAPRHYYASVWTGVEMIVWGGRDASTYFNTGGRYYPATDTWVATSTGANVPDGRQRSSAVWTGTEMIIWGGYDDNSGFLNTGARYNPATDTWAATSTGANLPGVRSRHIAVWTGTEMIVWGGFFRADSFFYLNSGGRYTPSTDTWSATSTGASVPDGRVDPTAVWTGTEVIVWGGGTDGPPEFNTGGRYNPSADTWAATSTGANAPDGRYAHAAVWTGSEMIVWGGSGNGSYLQTGGRYSPSTDAWSPTSIGASVPDARYYTTAVWTGAEMVVWGGYGSGYVNTGGRYDPTADSWTPTSTGANVPGARYYHTAAWTGTEMIVWSGLTGNGYVNTGGRYCTCVSPVPAYRDADGDGYGNAAVSIGMCGGSPPAGYVTDSTDCDDAHATVYPGAPESCNGVDDNCDSTVDNGGTALCNDGNGCTDDVCNGLAGCDHANNAAACDDGNACTNGDTCGGGSCQPGTPVVCDDANGCTDDSCNPATGCVVTNNAAACDDANACTTGDTCGGGSCQPGTPVVCDDANGCTDDSCNPATGCVVANNAAACDDGNACTTGETCNGGSCQPGAPVVCDDGNVCTDDSCDPATGCVVTNNTAACDDGNACTNGDSCDSGSCVPGAPVPPPTEVSGVVLDGDASTAMTWTGLTGGVVYDIASSTISELRANGTTTSTCLSNDVEGPGYSDGQANPAEGDGYYYLVRAQSACGSGSYGDDSAGAERTPTAACQWFMDSRQALSTRRSAEGSRSRRNPRNCRRRFRLGR